MDPFKLLKEAVAAVPAMKYALGVAGLAAVVAIVLGFEINSQVAVFGTLIVIGLMFVLLVFSKHAGAANVNFAGPAGVLVWFYTVVVMAATLLLMSSYFFHVPSISLWSDNVVAGPGPSGLLSGSVTLYDGYRKSPSVFNFASQQPHPWGVSDADMGVANPSPDTQLAQFFLHNDYPPYTDPNKVEHPTENSGIIDMHTQSLDLVHEAPSSDYKALWFVPQEAEVYCVRTRDGTHFAKIKISGIEKDRISFEYVYQPNGSRSFAH